MGWSIPLASFAALGRLQTLMLHNNLLTGPLPNLRGKAMTRLLAHSVPV